MPSYLEVQLSIPYKKLQALLEGEEIMLTKRHLKPGYPVPLSSTHKTKLEKFAKSEEKELPFKLSKANINHILKNMELLEQIDGSGFWKKIGRFFKKTGKAIAKGAKAVAPVLKKVAPILVDVIPGAKTALDLGKLTAREVVGDKVADMAEAKLKETTGLGMVKAKGRGNRKLVMNI